MIIRGSYGFQNKEIAPQVNRKHANNEPEIHHLEVSEENLNRNLPSSRFRKTKKTISPERSEIAVIVDKKSKAKHKDFLHKH